jgi:hypothetical protein
VPGDWSSLSPKMRSATRAAASSSRADHMGVDVGGKRRGGVAEALGHHLGRHAGGEPKAGVGMAEVVKPDSWQANPLDRPIEQLREVVGVDGSAVFAYENKVRSWCGG